MLTIKVLGAGCANCKQVEAAARKAVAGLGVEAQIIKITDYEEIQTYNVLMTPGLMIDDRLVAAGRVPSQQEVNTWVVDALAAA